METFRITQNDIGKTFLVKLLYDRARPAQTGGKYPKTVYQFGVQVDGVEKLLEASEALNNYLEKFIKGDELEVTLNQGEDGKKYYSVVKRMPVVQSETPTEPFPDEGLPPEPKDMPAQGSGAPPEPTDKSQDSILLSYAKDIYIGRLNHRKTGEMFDGNEVDELGRVFRALKGLI